jgi:AbiV family abortive infection protein
MAIKSVTSVSQDALLKGAWYALEQCGSLLRDAATLYSLASSSGAVALAMFAREELGRHDILLKMWEAAQKSGILPTVDEVRRACEDHQAKQRHGQLGVVAYRADRGSQLAGFSAQQTKHAPQTPEFERAATALSAFRDRRLKDTPNERHQARLAALYVDIDDAGSAWNRPSEIDAEFAYYCVVDAIGDYHNRCSRLSPEILKDDKCFSAALASALQAWTDKPDLRHFSHLPMEPSSLYR